MLVLETLTNLKLLSPSQKQHSIHHCNTGYFTFSSDEQSDRAVHLHDINCNQQNYYKEKKRKTQSVFCTSFVNVCCF